MNSIDQNSKLIASPSDNHIQPRGTAKYLAYAKERGFLLPPSMTPEVIRDIIFKANGDLGSLSEIVKKEIQRIGPTIRYLDCHHEPKSTMRPIEWTSEKVVNLVTLFPNLERLNFNGSLIKEFDHFLEALKPLKHLKKLQLNDVTLKDRHIEQLAKNTKMSSISCCMSVVGMEKKITAVFPRLVEYDARLNDIIDHDAKIEKLADGFEWVEGPIWNKKEGYLLFSDIPRNAIFKWKEGEDVSLFLHPSGYLGKTAFKGKEPGSNALTYDAKGQLHVCQHGERRIVRLGPDGEQIVVADRYQGKRLNSPNDLVFKSSGELYFTDPPYGLPLRYDDPEKEIPFSGVYRVKNGVVELLTKDLLVPNGLAFSPDEKYLYISNTGNKALKDPPLWYRFEVNADGTLGKKEIFYEGSSFFERRPGSPDGLKVDVQGNLYCAGPGGLYIFSPDTKLLGMIEFAEPTSNCNWGGKNNDWLYITSNHAVFRVPMKNKGTGV